MEDLTYEKRQGFMQFDNCPECQKLLLPIRKISECLLLVNAKICTNRSCFHYCDITRIDTWTETNSLPPVPHEERLPAPCRTL